MKVINQCHGANFSLYQADCIAGLQGLPKDSVHYSFFSPPFESLLVFSDNPLDLSNCKSSEEFQQHFRYFVRELYRPIMPGRLVTIHCCNLPTTVAKHGYTGLKDFRGDLIRLMMGSAAELIPALMNLRERLWQANQNDDQMRAEQLRASIKNICEELEHYQTDGFIFHSETVIWKDPGIAMKRNKTKGLLHKQIHKDAAACRQGIPDTLITFLKPGKNPEPVNGYLFDYAGSSHEPKMKYSFNGTPSEWAKEEQRLKNKTYKVDWSDPDFVQSVEIWNRYASPVWFDIDPGDILPVKGCKAEKDERHISPTQRTVTRRSIQLYTNPGDIVLDPFNGRGTTGYEAVQQGRKYVAFELKESYFNVSCQDLFALENQAQLSLV